MMLVETHGGGSKDIELGLHNNSSQHLPSKKTEVPERILAHFAEHKGMS
jgi:hypothetical protein